MLIKLLLSFTVVVAVMGFENGSIRRIRSPGPSGWQGSNGYGSPSVGLARSGGWGNTASSFGRSSGWGGSNGYAANAANYGSNGYSSGLNGKSTCSSYRANGWDDSSLGFRSNTGSSVW